MNGAEVEGTDWQAYIGGVGVIEFVELDSYDEFIEAMNPHILGEKELSDLQPRGTHSRVAHQLKDLRYEVALPNHIERIVESIYLQTIADTNDLAHIVLYANIDSEAFKDYREQRYVESGHPLRPENTGLDILSDVQSSLSQFLMEDVGEGFFSQTVEPAIEGRDMEHPGFWFYDFAEADISSLEEFQEIRHEETLFIGLGKEDYPEQGFTEYADGRCVVHGEGREYWVTHLGSFPFRYFFLRFEESAQVPLSILHDQEAEDEIPDDVESGYIPLAHAYALLFWAISTHQTLDENEPESTFESADIETELSRMSGSEKAEILDELHSRNRELDDFWNSRQEQFSSIKTIRSAQTGYKGEYEESVIQPLVLAGEEIEDLSEEQVHRYRERYQRLIERVQTHFETNIGLVGMKLSIVVFLLTVATIVTQLPSILSSDYSLPLLLILGAILLLIPIFLSNDSPKWE